MHPRILVFADSNGPDNGLFGRESPNGQDGEGQVTATATADHQFIVQELPKCPVCGIELTCE